MGFLSSLFGFGGDTPKTQQVVQATKLPEEIAPFAKEVLDEAKALYTQRMGEGYTPYEGPTIAPLTSEQEQAMAGITGLVGTQRPLQEEALGMFRSGATEKFTPEVAQEYMSLYQRAVTDVEKREAQRDFEGRIMPQFEKQAVGAGGMSGMGSRAGVQAAQLGKTQMERLGDIESKGLQSAYRDAQNLWGQQQQRERAAAGDIGKLAPAIYGSGIAELGALQTVGEQKQALGQEALDEAYFRHLERQAYPQEQLAGYSGFVYGNPLMQQRTRTTTMPAPVGPSMGQQLMGLGLGAAKLYGMAGAGTSAGPSWGTFLQSMGGGTKKTGGRISARTGGGLSSLPVVYRQQNAQIGTPPFDYEERFPYRGGGRRGPTIRWGMDAPILESVERGSIVPTDAPATSSLLRPSYSSYSEAEPLTTTTNNEGKSTGDNQGDDIESGRVSVTSPYTWKPDTKGIVELLKLMGMDDLFTERREKIERKQPKFSLGAAAEAALKVKSGGYRQQSLVEAFTNALFAGSEGYDKGVAEKEKLLANLDEDELNFVLATVQKKALLDAKSTGKFGEAVRKSLADFAAAQSGKGVRYINDKLVTTAGKQDVGPAVQLRFSKVFAELMKLYAKHWAMEKEETAALAGALDEWQTDNPGGALPLPKGTNQGPPIDTGKPRKVIPPNPHSPRYAE